MATPGTRAGKLRGPVGVEEHWACHAGGGEIPERGGGPEMGYAETPVTFGVHAVARPSAPGSVMEKRSTPRELGLLSAVLPSNPHGGNPPWAA
jgi:hypothetical protein